MWSARLVMLLASVMAAAVAACSSTQEPDIGGLPLRRVSETALTGGAVRFDYTALDAGRRLLFVAHMGAGSWSRSTCTRIPWCVPWAICPMCTG